MDVLNNWDLQSNYPRACKVSQYNRWMVTKLHDAPAAKHIIQY